MERNWRDMTARRGSLKDQVLLAALSLVGDNPDEVFTFEELLVRTWEGDRGAWGLRGFEQKHPDSERLHRELDSRGKTAKGLVDSGSLEKVRTRVYRLTPKGLAAASKSRPEDVGAKEMADRVVEHGVRRVLEHPIFRQWLKDSSRPRHFRDAGRFWGIAPGTPPRVIKERVLRVETDLMQALEVLDQKGVDGVRAGRGKLTYDRTDIKRCLEFQGALKARFSKDLSLLAGEPL
jgi:hypothetical protein